MPGKCKFQDSWLRKEAFRDWLVKDADDIHFARCKACCKSIKLQTMGEAALTSHAGGAGHKAAVRKLLEGGLIGDSGRMNGNINWVEKNKEQIKREALDRIISSDWSDLHQSSTTNSISHSAELQDAAFPVAYFKAPGGLIGDSGRMNGNINWVEKNKEQIKREALDRIISSDWSDLHQSSTTNSISHSAELQDAAFPVVYFTAPGTSRTINHLNPSDIKEEDVSRRLAHHDTVDISRFELQQRTETLEQLEQMKILEWENRMKVLAWEQELVREKRKAARQKQKAFRMKKAYYKAKLKRLGEDVPPSSSSSDEE